MSMNICIESVGDIKYPNGKVKKARNMFDAIQTPTKISYKIINSKDPLNEYFSYILSLSEPELDLSFYNYEDLYNYEVNEVLKEGTYYYTPTDWAYDHMERLKYWILEQEELGFKIEISVH